HAARGQPPDDPPIDRAAQPMYQAAAGLGGGRIEKVGAHGGRGMDAEQENKDWGHQGPPADTRHSHQEPDSESRERIQQIERVHDAPDPTRVARARSQQLNMGLSPNRAEM